MRTVAPRDALDAKSNHHGTGYGARRSCRAPRRLPGDATPQGLADRLGLATPAELARLEARALDRFARGCLRDPILTALIRGDHAEVAAMLRLGRAAGEGAGAPTRRGASGA